MLQLSVGTSAHITLTTTTYRSRTDAFLCKHCVDAARPRPLTHTTVLPKQDKCWCHMHKRNPSRGRVISSSNILGWSLEGSMHCAPQVWRNPIPLVGWTSNFISPNSFRLLILHRWQKNGVLHWKSPLGMWVETIGGTSYLLSARLKRQLLHNLHPHGRLLVAFGFELCVFHVVVVKH